MELCEKKGISDALFADLASGAKEFCQFGRGLEEFTPWLRACSRDQLFDLLTSLPGASPYTTTGRNVQRIRDLIGEVRDG